MFNPNPIPIRCEVTPTLRRLQTPKTTPHTLSAGQSNSQKTDFVHDGSKLPAFPGTWSAWYIGQVEAYRFGLNPQYNSETASTDPTYAVEQFAWVWISEIHCLKTLMKLRQRERDPIVNSLELFPWAEEHHLLVMGNRG